MKEQFMQNAIRAHALQIIPVSNAKEYLWEGATYDDAKKLAETSSVFERKDFIVIDEDYRFPPQEKLRKSFNKWLAVQTHDVKGVTSLYLWEREVASTTSELWAVICELEEVADGLSNKETVNAILTPLEEEYLRLAALSFQLKDAIDKVRRTPKPEQAQRVA